MGASSFGVIYVAYGRNARAEARRSAESLGQYHRRWPVVVVADEPVGWARTIETVDPSRGTPGRWAKVNLDNLSPFDHTLFLDADTRVHGPLDVGFHALADGWDLVIVPAIPQGDKALAHLRERERETTFNKLGGIPLQLNTGVMWFNKSDRLHRFFDCWRTEWARWKDKDQGALARALAKCPLRLWLLGRPFNGGEVVEHLFGAARG